MKTISKRAGVRPAAASAICLVAAALSASAQEEESSGEIFEFSPFVVHAGESAGYQATATLAGAGVRTSLRDVGSAISVITDQFIQDTGSTRSEDLLVYTTSTEVSGPRGNFMGGGDGEFVEFKPVGSTRVRGLAGADELRDFFLTEIPWDAYNVGRIDLQRGPNAVLFGIGSPAGIINATTKVASFGNSNSVEISFDNFGSTRLVGDFNRELLEDVLALRIALLDDNTDYRQDPAFRDDTRLYATMAFNPKALNGDGRSTSFTAKYEVGEIQYRDPVQTPPMDHITPWFGHLNKATYPLEGSHDLTSPGTADFNPYLNRNPYGFHGQQIAVFADPESSTLQSFQDSNANGLPSAVMAGIASYGDWAFYTERPGHDIRPFKAKSLTDSSIFDYYEKLLSGPNGESSKDFDALNLNFSQTFLGNRLGYDLKYDRQNFTGEEYTTFGNSEYIISVDIMETLDDGSPNPNLGRPFTLGSGNGASGSFSDSLAESVRGTLFAEYDFAEKRPDGFWSRLLGKHVLTAAWTDYEVNRNRRFWRPYWIEDIIGTDVLVGNPITDDDRKITSLHYLGSSLLGVGSPRGLNLDRVRAVQEPYDLTVSIVDQQTQEIVKTPILITNATRDFDFDNRPYTGGSKIRDEIESLTLVWQAHLFDGHVVPMYGYREDRAATWNSGPPDLDEQGVALINDPSWTIPSDADNLQDGQTHNGSKGTTKTYSLVVKAPSAIEERLGGAGLSLFYNQSENFQPKPGRRDILGNFVENPTGETKDYGLSLELMKGKLFVKVNRYETKVLNDDISASLNLWGTVNTEAFLMRQAIATRDRDYRRLPVLRNDPMGRKDFGKTSENSKYGAGNGLVWEPMPWELSDPDMSWQEGGTYTQEAIDHWYDIQEDAVKSFLENPIPDSMIETWGMEGYGEAGYWAEIDSGALSSVVVTGSTVSKGTEIEIVANPIEGLDISVNAARTDAKRVDLAGSWSGWIERRWQEVQSLPLGHMRMWSNHAWNVTNGKDTALGNYQTRVMPNYNLARALEGASVPELRPWRFNAVVNYEFQDGPLGGYNLGGSYRWMDEQVVGFDLNDSLDAYDVESRWYGPSESTVDLWASKKFKINDRVNWHIQLNIRNLFASDELIPLTVQPDGSPGQFRIPEPRRFLLRNTIEF